MTTVLADRYSINEAARRSGFTPATLRYYEEIGLLTEVARTGSGYRMYDDRQLERLAFIARAKQLGCTLDETTDLVKAWNGGECGPVQDRLRTLVAAKLATARERAAELITITSELQQAAEALEFHRPEGPCDDRCGCVAPSSAVPSGSVTFSARRPSSGDHPPIACTLAPESMIDRRNDWRQMLTAVRAREATDHGVRLRFDRSVDIVELSRLCAAEQQCCAFLRFTITIDGRWIDVEVVAPADAIDLLHDLLGWLA